MLWFYSIKWTNNEQLNFTKQLWKTTETRTEDFFRLIYTVDKACFFIFIIYLDVWRNQQNDVFFINERLKNADGIEIP